MTEEAVIEAFERKIGFYGVSLEKALVNLKKSPKSRMTQSYLDTKRRLADDLWSKYNSILSEACVSLKDDEVQTVHCLREGAVNKIEETYIDIMLWIEENSVKPREEKSQSGQSSSGSNQSGSDVVGGKEVLKPLSLPTFNGDFKSWATFHDLFVSLVHDNKKLSKVQKLQYLKSTTSHEVEDLLAPYAITEVNYDDAWALILRVYNNNHMLVDGQLDILFSLKPVLKESAVKLKSLIYGTDQVLKSLKNSGIVIDNWDYFIIHLTSRKLPSETRSLWEQEIAGETDLPEFDRFLTFVEKRYRSLIAVGQVLSGSDPVVSHLKAVSTVAKSSGCPACRENHDLERCPKFIAMDLKARWGLIKKSFICFRCLKMGHKVASCKILAKCMYCVKYHHTLLHDPASDQSKPDSKAVNHRATVHYTTTEGEKEKVFATALVNVETGSENVVTLRAIIDPTSNSCFITSKACRLLQKSPDGNKATLTGLGGRVLGSATGTVSFGISSIYDSEVIREISALVVQSVSSKQPSRPLSEWRRWNGNQNLRLADPMFHVPGEIDLLLDVEVFSVIIKPGLIRTPGCPNLHMTALGWIVLGIANQSGNVMPVKSKPVDVLLTSASIESQLRKFWEQEECVKGRLKSPEDIMCEDLFKETTYRKNDGRFVVCLPMKGRFGQKGTLGESRKVVHCRFTSLENRLNRDSCLRQKYEECINEYFELDQVAKAGPVNEDSYYIPHHAVNKSGKFRVVFDASCKTEKGLSLNDAMYAGPKLQAELCVVINNWRRYRFAFQSDIEKMYRQIEVSEEDANRQRILWRVDKDSPVEDFQLLRLTFGVRAAPYLAMRTLHALADNEGHRFSEAQYAVKNELYVDDLRSGGDTVEEAIGLRKQVSEMLESGKFPWRKWVANDNRVLSSVPIEHRDKHGQLEILEGGTETSVKSLGLLWDPKGDVFRFHIKKVNPCVRLTKRVLLSKIAGLYDPMGWISPVIVKEKILMQGLWEFNCDWDELVAKDVEREWLLIESSLSELREISVPRWIKLTRSMVSYQIHSFCDASVRAVAAVAYLRVIDDGGNIFVHLLSSKSRVAPLKTVTLPRLELCGAVLAAELSQSICESLKLEKGKSFFWSDSEIALAWIRKPPQKWTTYVANRVSSVQSASQTEQWSYVCSKENPADCCSRGLLPRALVGHDLWWSGPPWLSKPESEWPKRGNEFETSLELKIKAVLLTRLSDSFVFVDNYSSLRTAIRVVPWILRWVVPFRFRSNSLSVADLKHSLMVIVRLSQSVFFGQEIDLVRNEKGRDSKGQLRRSMIKLSPFLDAHGVLRVGGRIRHSQLAYNKRHPVILPKEGHSTHLVIRDAHECTLRGSVQETLRYLRNEFWVLGGRNTVQKELTLCVSCNRVKARLCVQVMADLPIPRVVSEGQAFNHTGLDYAGPFMYRASALRKAQRLKCYVALFVCFTTKAVSLQLVTDKSTDAFMRAFSRFTSTRGKPSTMYSDNEPAFVGADRFMEREWYEALQAVHEESKDLLANDGINWLFNPPEAPHQGGLWESNVKSAKRHLLASLGSALLTYEELSTVLSKIEACLNSRPLRALSEDPEDVEVLTPGHFLVGRPLLSVPESTVLHLNDNVLSRWRYMRKLSQTFWQRWSQEYLVTLQNRNKWLHKGRELKNGDLVLLKEDLVSPLKWRRGRIVETMRGKDSRVRVVKVKTMSNVLTRDVRRVCLLLPDQSSVHIGSTGGSTSS